jgi:hypothetical protein
MKLVAPKAGAKNELLFNELASGQQYQMPHSGYGHSLSFIVSAIMLSVVLPSAAASFLRMTHAPTQKNIFV